ncbi:MAG TPA: sigma-70 family RNA polymerase sigma factor [Saprospiraceae bacterium]|nr:sigma-70 family RNA polymerase sigma factor [Saprospiraceae bacterium]
MPAPKEINKLVDHIFRHESGKIVSGLIRIFGIGNIDLAEDVLQDSLLEAMDHWLYNGIPVNPSAWLFRVAKNKALNILQRDKYKRVYSSEIVKHLKLNNEVGEVIDLLFSEKEIEDDQLRMIFTCCHPAISRDSQIALALKTLCGLSIPEIAKAFLTTEGNIKKRLFRARQKLRDGNIAFEVPSGRKLNQRLMTVLETIYLLFNEGYSASKGNDLIRYELCEEAMNLTDIIINNAVIKDKSEVYALKALMQLNASRFNARLDSEGSILTLEEQNRAHWNYELMEEGFVSLKLSTLNEQISSYHILATISAYHCSAVSYKDTDWKSILALYDNLLIIDSSAVVKLNRIIALSKVKGEEKAIIDLKALEDSTFLRSYYLYYATLSSFYIELKQYNDAIPVLKTAIELAPMNAEKLLLNKKLNTCLEYIIV